MGIIEILTIVFIVMKLAGVGACANWDIIAAFLKGVAQR